MRDILEFERALDNELDKLSTRIEQALARVRGNKEAEMLFLTALNKMMASKQ